MRRARRALSLAGLLLVACAAPAIAQEPAPPQAASLDTEAPLGSPPHWLPNEQWVMQHWLPYDERRLERLLGVTRGRIWRLLRDDTRSLAQLAEARGWEPRALARALVAPWRGRLREPHRLRVLEQRALRTLTQGHLAQHIFFHSLHQDAIPANAPEIFGTATREEFAALRRSELSPLQICRLNGLSRGHALERGERTLRAMAARGVEGQAMPAVQARRLLARQLRQLPRWLQQTRYNGPPPLDRPRPSVATASNYSNNAVLSGNGSRVAFEGYEAALAAAKGRGEIRVMAARVGGRPEPASAPEAATLRSPPRSDYNPSLSADGAWVAFEAAAGNLNFAKRYGQMGIRIRNLESGATLLVGHPGAGPRRSDYAPVLSADGGRVAYESSDARTGSVDVWVTDWRSGRAWRARSPRRDASEPALSGDGRVLAFTASGPGGGSAVFRQDLRSGAVRRLSPAGVEAWEPVLSHDGTVAAFTVRAGARGSQVVIHDGADRATALRAVGAAGRWSSEPSLSADGARVAFTARTPADRRGGVHVYDRATGATVLASRAAAPADGASGRPHLSADGRRVAFTSDAWNLSARKCNGARGVFVRDLARGETTLVSAGDGANRWLGPTRGSSVGGDMRLALLCA